MNVDQRTEQENSNGTEQEANNVEKIRDILFGTQMRDYDKKFARMEERLNKNAQEMRDDIDKRLKLLEAFMKVELTSLVEQLRSEKEERLESSKTLAAELKESGKAGDHRIKEFQTAQEKAHAESRQHALREATRLCDAARKETAALAENVARGTEKLHANFIKRDDLSSLFGQLALHLKDDDGAKPRKSGS